MSLKNCYIHILHTESMNKIENLLDNFLQKGIETT